jgi:hypothetical protein
LRCMVVGQHHHVSPQYLPQYANHAAWLPVQALPNDTGPQMAQGAGDGLVLTGANVGSAHDGRVARDAAQRSGIFGAFAT